jgi:hypothetical protein
LLRDFESIAAKVVTNRTQQKNGKTTAKENR